MTRRTLAASVLLIAIFAIPLVAQKARIAGPIDGNQPVVLKKQIHPLARPEFDRGPVDPATRLDYVTMVLKPTDAQQSDLEALLIQQQDRSSPNFHRWLTPEQFGNRFGLAASDVAVARSWLVSQGLQIEDTARGKNWIAFSGSVGQVQRAFQTEIHHFEIGGKRHFANATELVLPGALAGVVRFFRGLDDLEPEPPSSIRNQTPLPSFNSASGSHSLSPDDFAILYNLTPLYNAGITGEGQSIAIIGRSGIDLPGYATFRTLYGLPVNPPVLHLVGRDPGTGNSGDVGEAMLDVEWSGAVARNATIIYVYATSVNTAAQEAVDKNLAPVMSFSYGICEQRTPDNMRNLAQQASAQGITWLVASGDNGAAGCDAQFDRRLASVGLAAGYPASIPEVTAVGGTMFSEAGGTYWNATNTSTGGSVLSRIPEVAWNESNASGLSASGGGVSSFYPKPFWQNGPGVPADNARDVPDISLTASNHDAYRTYQNGTNFITWGTSAAAPSFAGIMALMNQYQVTNGLQPAPGMGNINPGLYRLAQTNPEAFNDVTGGDNVVPCVQSSASCLTGSFGYAAGPGYDLATGLGSVDANNLITHWNQSVAPSQTGVTAASSSIPFGAKAQLTATVTAASGAGTPTGTVAFLVPGGAVGAPILGTAALVATGGIATASIPVDPNRLALGDNSIVAVYSGDNNFDVSSGSVTVTVTPPANAAAIVVSVSPNPVYATASATGVPTWTYSFTLTNESAVTATLTTFVADGVDNSSRLSTFFSSTRIAANGTLQGAVASTALNVPLNRVFVFGGTDANGNSWTQQVTVPFVAPLRQAEIVLSASPVSVQQNPSADPSCLWQQRLNLQEVGGFTMQLTRFLAGTKDLTSQISQYFGTAQMAPLGALQATLCSSGSTPPASLTYEVDAVTDGGTTFRTTLAASYAAAQTAPAALSADQSLITLSTPTTSDAVTAPLNVKLTGGTSNWTATIFPSNLTTSWLKLSSASGTATGLITLTASAKGQAPGVYRATVILQGSNAVPQSIEVPVTFTVGASPDISIGGVTNGASFQTSAAPGMVLAVFGTGLAPNLQLTGGLPLPLSLQGVSATVNGVAAPLYFVSDAQINLQVPYEVGAGPAVVGINNNGKLASFSFTVAPSAPGIFVQNGNLVPKAAGNPGDVLALYMTGAGDVSPSVFTGASPATGTPTRSLPAPRLPLTVTVGGLPATIQFAGIPVGLVGTTQVNFVIPADVPAGVQPVVVTNNGVSSTAANITVGP